MKLEENRDAGWGVREFHNVELPPVAPRPGHIDLRWSSKVVQRGTKETTGRLWDAPSTFRWAQETHLSRRGSESHPPDSAGESLGPAATTSRSRIAGVTGGIGDPLIV